MKITTGQNRRLHSLLQRRGLMEEKANLVLHYTDGRTEHSSELLYNEAIQIIRALDKDNIPASAIYKDGDSQRKRILSICYQLPVELGFTRWSMVRGKRMVDMDRLNRFLTGPKSIYKKELMSHTPRELTKVIVQFENMLNGYYKPGDTAEKRPDQADHAPEAMAEPDISES